MYMRRGEGQQRPSNCHKCSSACLATPRIGTAQGRTLNRGQHGRMPCRGLWRRPRRHARARASAWRAPQAAGPRTLYEAAATSCSLSTITSLTSE